MASKLHARWRLKAQASHDYVRLGLTRLEDRVVLDAAAAAVVADINPGVPSSAPAELTPYNGSLYFSASGTNATGQAVGRELYKLDSGGSVTLVADINPGASDANPAGFTVFNGDLIFAATGPQGRELYRLDAAGNVTVFANVNPGSASSSPQSLMAIDNKLFFTAEVNLGRELYIANQGGGISLVADLRPGAAGSDPSDFVQFNGDLYFAATNASLRGLYRVNSQGSSSPTAIYLGTGVSDPREFTEYFGNLYFSAVHPTDGRELFLMYINNSNREVVNRIANFDGTSASSAPSDFHVFQDALYFAATTQNGRELWRVINDGDADDRQFLSSDDYRQFNIAPGSASSSPGGFATFNNTLYFAATVNGQRGLYRMSGNSVVAVPLPTGVTLPVDTVLTPLSNGLYFAANGPSGRELHSLDAAGSVGLVADVNFGAASSNPAEIVQFAGKTYFVATTADVGRELFVLGNYPSSLRVDNGVLVFRDEAGDKDNRIVAFSDGTRLHIIDQNGHSIALLTSLTGATGAGTSEIIVPLSSLAGVNSFSINTRGGNDSVTYDLSSFANTFLSRFSTLLFDGGTNNDALRFVGDGVLQATYTPDPTITGKGLVAVGSGSLTSNFRFSNLEPVDFTGFAIARLVAPNTVTDIDQLTISNAKDSLFGTTDALVVAGTVGGTWIESAYFFGNGLVLIDTSAGGDGIDTVSIVSANNAHANASLRIKTFFGFGLFSQDAVVVSGDVVLAGSFTIETTQLTIDAAVTTGGNINLTALHDIVMSANGRLASNNAPIRLIGDANGIFGGGIVMADGALINSGSGTIFLQATDDITLGRLVTTNGTNTALQVYSLAGRVLDGGDSGGANLEANGANAVVTIRAARGVGASGNPLDLAVRQLVVVTANSAQYLSELDDLERLDLRAGIGQIYLTVGGAIQDSDAFVDVQAAAWNVQATAIGTLANPLQTALGTLNATVTSGGLYLTQVYGSLNVANVTAPGASAIVSIAALAGDLQLSSITASSAHSLVVLQTPNGAIRDANGAALNLTAHAAELAAAQGIGVGNTLETTLSQLVANGGSGGVFLQNNGDLELGNVAGLLGLSGITANNANLQINTSGTLLVSETAQTSGSGAILLSATADISLLSSLANNAGQIKLLAAHDLLASRESSIRSSRGAIELTPGGTLSFAGSIFVGTGSVTFVIVDSASQMQGVISGAGNVIKQGIGTLTLTASSLNAYTGTTDLLAGTLRVDGVIGAIGPARRFTLADGTTLIGGGIVNAPIYSISTSTFIVPTGNLSLGDGSTAGFDFAGQLLVGPGQFITLHDADLAQLGALSSIAGSGRLLATNGVEVGSGETLTGSGAVAGNLFVMPGGYVSPGAGVGVLATDQGDLNLLSNATLVLQLFGTLAGAQYDQLNVRGAVSIEGAILSLQGGLFRPADGFVFTLLVNDGVDPISGRFRDANGQLLGEGARITVGGIAATLSYKGGLGGNDITLTTPSRTVIVQTQSDDTTMRSIVASRAQMQEANFQLARSSIVARPIMIEAPPPPVNNTSFDVNAATLELRQTERIRVYFRIVNGATGQDEAKQYELDPNVLRDVLGFFKRYKLQDNHYRIYLQEPGKKERLILDLHIVDGRIVPPNFRETESQGTTAPSKAAPEAIPTPPPSVEATPPSQMESGDANPQSATPDRGQDKSAAALVAPSPSPAISPWDVRLRAALADDHVPLDKIGRLVRKAR